jgi:hypothetical protein
MSENYYNSSLSAAEIEAKLTSPDLFMVTYNVTRFLDIQTAYNAGKVIALKIGDDIYWLTRFVANNSAYFSRVSGYDGTDMGGVLVYYDVFHGNTTTYYSRSKTLQDVSFKATSLSADSTDFQYPSAKCTFDALALKADAADLTAHTEATDNPHAVTKAQVGLGSVDNTADADKPVSTAQQTALDLKAPLESPALTGMPTAPTAAEGTDNTQIATTAFAKAVAESKAADVAALVSVASAADVQAVLEV